MLQIFLTGFLQELTLIAVGILGAIMGIFVWAEHRKANKLKEELKVKKEEERFQEMNHQLMLTRFREELKVDMTALINNSLSNYVNKTDFEVFKRNTDKELYAINERFDSCHKEIIQLQKASLRAEIVTFANDIRDNKEKTRSAYKYIAHCYDKYKAIGGNNYVDEEWDYIKESMKNVRKN